jgi:hypothetical protein
MLGISKLMKVICEFRLWRSGVCTWISDCVVPMCLTTAPLGHSFIVVHLVGVYVVPYAILSQIPGVGPADIIWENAFSELSGLWTSSDILKKSLSSKRS